MVVIGWTEHYSLKYQPKEQNTEDSLNGHTMKSDAFTYTSEMHLKGNGLKKVMHGRWVQVFESDSLFPPLFSNDVDCSYSVQELHVLQEFPLVDQ